MKTLYEINVRYRTNSGCNVKCVTVEALDVWQALELASAKVRRQRGVIRIDGGDWREPLENRPGYANGGC